MTVGAIKGSQLETVTTACSLYLPLSCSLCIRSAWVVLAGVDYMHPDLKFNYVSNWKNQKGKAVLRVCDCVCVCELLCGLCNCISKWYLPSVLIRKAICGAAHLLASVWGDEALPLTLIKLFTGPNEHDKFSEIAKLLLVFQPISSSVDDVWAAWNWFWICQSADWMYSNF